MGRRSHFFKYPGLSTTVLRELSSILLSAYLSYLYEKLDVIRKYYCPPFTPLTNPPRCPVMAITIAVRNCTPYRTRIPATSALR